MIWTADDHYGLDPPVAMTQAQYEHVVESTQAWPGGHPSRFPTQNELRAVGSLIDSEVCELNELDLELKRIADMHNFVKRKQHDLAKKFEAHRAYIAPIRRIPDDIVEEIMMQCLPTDALPSHTNTHVAPVLLTHICSRWRCIALSTPILWASLCVSFRLNRPKPDENPWNEPTRWTHMRRFSLQDVSTSKLHADLVSIWDDDTSAMRHWLSMTGTCPLTISFGYIPQIINPIPCLLHFFQFLLSTSPQWRSIDLIPSSAASKLPLYFQSEVLSQNTPLLRLIRFPVIQPAIASITPELSWTKSTIMTSPQLRQLVWRGQLSSSHPREHDATECNSPLSTLIPVRSWAQITALSVYCTQIHEAEDSLKALYMCHSLERFRIQSQDERWLHDQPVPIQSDPNIEIKLLPRLHTLDLDLPQDILQKSLHAIAAPMLEDLSIHMTSQSDVTPDSFAEDLHEFFMRSRLIGCTSICTGMHTLRINPIHYTAPTMYKFLEAFSGIRTLVLKTEYDHYLRSLRYADTMSLKDRFAAQDPAAVTLSGQSHVDDAFLHRVGMLSPEQKVVQAVVKLALGPKWCCFLNWKG